MKFDDRVRNQLKDFVGNMRWSVSQFAQRYRERFGEMFSKMEAPSVSTARKLIEDKSHAFSEREVKVLELMTGKPLFQLWLEEQHRILLAKSAEYGNSSETMDGESIVKWDIRRLSEYPSQLTADDVVGVIRRYLDADTKMPLVILCGFAMPVRALLAEHFPEVQRVAAAVLGQEGRDMPFDAIYGFIPSFVTSAEGGRAFREALEIMQADRGLGRSRHVILLYEVYDREETEQAVADWGRSALVFPVTLPVAEEPQEDEPQTDLREKCLSRMRTLPDLFKKEIMACPIFPKFDSAYDCADYIMGLYQEQSSYFEEGSEMYVALDAYIKLGLSPQWLDADYDRKSMLIGLLQYSEWKVAKEEELTEAGINPAEDELHLAAMGKINRIIAAVFTKADSLSCDAEMWRKIFENVYNSFLVES